MTITQGPQKLITTWSSFDIGANASVDIRQPSGGILVNKVSGTKTTIDGSLSASGSVYIVNPAGVLVNAGATINAGALVLSALPLDEKLFEAGRTVFHPVGDAVSGSIENHGTLTARAGTNGTVALIGGTVINDGTVIAQAGTAALASANTVELNFASDDLTKIVVSGNAVRGAIENHGLVQADGGQVVMTARTAENLIGLALNRDGVVQAQSVATRAGRILLDGGSGIVQIDGKVDASSQPGVAGGNIDVTGGQVQLMPNALLDARGDAASAQGVGGGRVRIGGVGTTARLTETTDDAAADLARAGSVVMDKGAQVLADARTTGKGGTVIIDGGWARLGGALSANGGARAGDGGTIETSPDALDASNAQISAHAPHGTAGVWLVDPPGGAVHVVADAPVTASSAGAAPPAGQLSAAAIGRALSDGTSVTVRTLPNNAISVEAPIQKTVQGAPSDVSLNLQAGGDISMTNEDPHSIAAAANSGALAMSFQTDYASTATPSHTVNLSRAGFTTNGGDFTVRAPNIYLDQAIVDTTVSGNPATSGNVSMTATGNGFGTMSINASTITTSSGSIDLRAVGGGLTITSLLSGTSTQSLVPTKITSGTGAIRIYGSKVSRPQIAQIAVTDQPAATAPAPAVSAAVRLENVSVNTQGGAIDVRGVGLEGVGYGSGAGISLNNVSMATLGGPQAYIALTGQSSGYYTTGIVMRGSNIGAATQQGDIILRAQGGLLGTALDLGTSATENHFRTQGNLDVMPGGVDQNFALVAADTTPITIGDNPGTGYAAATGSSPYASTFAISSNDLAQMSGVDTLIAGSATQKGRITLYSQNVPMNLTLENLGAGSDGIATSGGVNAAGKMLMFASTGDVTVSGPVIADTVLLSGPGRFTFPNAGNSVNTLAASNAGSVSFTNAHGFTIGAVKGSVYGNATQNATAGVTDASATSVQGALFAQALAGNIGLGGGPVSTHGVGGGLGASGAANVNASAGGAFNLVMDGAGGHFVNAGNGNLSSPAKWRIWADTWNGETRGPVLPGGALPNRYGCAYGQCTPDPLNDTFLYTQRPTVTVTIDDEARDQGAANPALTWHRTGVRSVDSPDDAANGKTFTTADAGSGPGVYDIGGTFTSPEGYLVKVVGGKLTVNAAKRGGGGGGGGTTSPSGGTTGPGGDTRTTGPGGGTKTTLSGGGTQTTDPPPTNPLPPAPGALFGQSGLQTFFSDAQRSFIYDSNLAGVMTRGGAGVCTGSNQPLASNLPADAAADALAVEWRRVRTQPNLNNCIIVNRQHGCGDF
ncbi:hypothetical protein CR51_13800 [Caballeronia megalochromosomata]|nr:hypothetical protein CR51_13800 [Caballeronia megalochromosomata]